MSPEQGQTVLGSRRIGGAPRRRGRARRRALL